MSIRFRCQSCGQKLRVGDDKAGQRAKCPRCKSTLTVPPASVEPEEPSPPPSAAETAPHQVDPDAPKIPDVAGYEENVEWVYESDSPSPAESVVDYDKVAVPRRVLYVQGILLGVVALVAFILGLLMRSNSSEQVMEGTPRSCLLSGNVTYSTIGGVRPDAGSVLILLPLDRHPVPDNKAPVEGLRPGDPEPLAENASLRLIRGLGGDYTRADANGAFEVRVPGAGIYYVLVISSHAPRSPQDELEKIDVAQVGRYFDNPIDLLADRKYRWSQLTVRRDRSLDVQF